MERNIKIRGIVLKKIRIGESNVGISLLTERDEVLFVMAFGATKIKNKLFGAVNPFVLGDWDLYYDPVKNHWRVKEASVVNYHESLQSSLEVFYTASLFSEVILKSQGSDNVYTILISSLKNLEVKGKRVTVLIQFMLRFLYNQGVLSSFSNCGKCEKEIKKESMFYIGQDELVCRDCLHGSKYIELNPGICIYCERTPSMDFYSSIKVGLGDSSLMELKVFLLTIIKKHTEGKLLTLDSCDGLI